MLRGFLLSAITLAVFWPVFKTAGVMVGPFPPGLLTSRAANPASVVMARGVAGS